MHRSSLVLLLCAGVAAGQGCGDCNSDGSVTVLDALSAAQVGVGLLTPTPLQQVVCDVEASGSITVVDALRIAQVAAGLPVPLGCPPGTPGCTILGPAPGSSQRGEVQLDLDLFAPGAASVTVTVELSTDAGATFTLATPAAGSPPPLAVNPAPGVVPPAPASFIWDAPADLPQSVAPVQLRVTVDDGSTTASCSVSFQVDTTCGCIITGPAGGTWREWVPILLELPACGSFLTLHVEHSTDGGLTWSTSCAGPASSFLSNPSPPLPSGSSQLFSWDTLCDQVGTGGATPVDLRVTTTPGGACVTSFSVDSTGATPVAPMPWDLVICEVLQNPAAVPDSQGEWFEVLSIAPMDVDLAGCTITDDDTDSYQIPLAAPVIVPPWGRVVLGLNDDPGTNGGVTVAHEYSGITLDNADDELVISNPAGMEVVRIAYDGGPIWPDPTGASMQLDDPMMDPIAAQDGHFWCESLWPWAPGTDLGSPGMFNDICMGMPFGAPTCTLLGSQCDSGDVILGLDLQDPDSAFIDVTLYWSTDGGSTFTLCTMSAASPPPLAVNPATMVPAGVLHTLLWDSLADCPGYSGIATVRADLSDGTHGGRCELRLVLDNLPGNQPPGCTITAPVGSVVAGGEIPITFTVTDPDTPGLWVYVRFSTDGGLTFNPTCAAAGSSPPYDANPALAPPGGAQTFRWDRLCDLAPAGPITLRVIVDDCHSTATCDATFTLGPSGATPQPGELLISEVMQDPAMVPDAQGEWFEVRNLTGQTLDLAGCTIRDDGTELHVIPLGIPVAVPASGYQVLGINADPLTNGNVAVGYEYSGFTLGNDDDEVILENTSGVEVARVAYDGGLAWPDPTGASMQLDTGTTDPALAVLPAYWCQATMPWGMPMPGDLGSPGWFNEPCPLPPISPPSCQVSVPACGGATVTLTLDTFDLDSPALDCTLRHSTDAGLTYRLCTPAAGSPPPLDVNPAPGVPPGAGRTFLWDVPGDLAGYTGPVRLQVQVSDGMHLEWCEEELVVDLTPASAAPVCAITAPAGGSLPGGAVAIDFDLADPDSPGLWVTAEFSTDAGVTYQLACMDASSPAPYHQNPAPGVPGTGQQLVWANLCDAVGPGSITFRLTVDDCHGTGSCTTTFTLTSSGAQSPQPGDLLITEVLQDPAAVPDAQGEWFEVLNLSGTTVDLDGCRLQDLGSDLHVIAPAGVLPLAPGTRIVLGNNANPATNGGVPVGYQYSGFTLDNGADEILLLDPLGVEVVRIEYDGGPLWPDPVGASMNLDDPIRDPVLAQDGSNWCPASAPWGGAGDLGSPGAVNEVCLFIPMLPPECWLSPPLCGTGDVTVPLDVFDPDTFILDVTIRYSTDGGSTYALCTPAASSPPPYDVNPALGVMAMPGMPFIWASQADLGGSSVGVLLQIEVSDGAFTRFCEASLVVNNVAAGVTPTCTITAPAGGTVPAGAVDVTFDLVDPDSTGILVSLEHSTDGGVTFHFSTLTAGAPPPLPNPVLRAPGAGQILTWDSLRDGVLAGAVVLRLRGNDCGGSSSCTTTVTLSAPPATPPSGPLQLVLSEVHADPAPGAAGDANGDGSGHPQEDEFLELVNISGQVLDLAGVTISDGAALRHTFGPGSTLAPGRAVVVFGAGVPAGGFGGSMVQTASTGGLALDDGGDTVLIESALGVLLDSYTYGPDGGMDQSLASMPEPSSLYGDPGGRPMMLHTMWPPGLLYSPGMRTDGMQSSW